MAQLLFGTGDSTGFGTKDTGTATSASFKRAYLSNMQIGDLLVAYIHDQSGTSSQTITAPAGWVAYGPNPGQPSWPTTRLASIYYYPIKNQADLNNLPATITWTFSVYNSRVACVVARATGIDLDNIEDVEATSATGGTGNSSALTIGGVTTVSANTLLVGALYHHNSVNTISPSTTSFMTGFEEYKTAPTGSAAANSGVAIGYTELSSAGATGTVAATFDSNVTASGGFLVAFKTASWAGPAEEGQVTKYTIAPDILADGALWFTSATDTLTSPAEVRCMPAGYASVTDMLAASPFYIAHRGGSLNWPELSLYAFTQAAFWGAGAFELSLARTSDGVWFGLHDSTLDRTSGTTGFTASDHTWAEVQAYAITAAETTDPAQSTQPYMRFEELMDTYYASHVIVVDPKGALAYIEELLDMMDALPGTPTDKFVAKYYGLTPTWTTAASARGYKTWGYFYDSNAADLPTYQGYYDILGMEFNASAGTWTTVTSYGKPVIAHTVRSNTDAATAITRGASGMMVAGVEEIIPRP